MLVAELTFFLSSGLPFFTVATNMSPTPAAGRRFKRPRMPMTAITYKFLPPKIKITILVESFRRFYRVLPVLSAQLMTAPTGQAREMRNLPPADPPRPERKRRISFYFWSKQKFVFFFVHSPFSNQKLSFLSKFPDIARNSTPTRCATHGPSSISHFGTKLIADGRDLTRFCTSFRHCDLTSCKFAKKRKSRAPFEVNTGLRALRLRILKLSVKTKQN